MKRLKVACLSCVFVTAAIGAQAEGAGSGPASVACSASVAIVTGGSVATTAAAVLDARHATDFGSLPISFKSTPPSGLLILVR